jgi:hypothetical protein
MRWRQWSVIVVLLLANYLVFSALAVWVFPPTGQAIPVRAVQPTFTVGAPTLQRVGTLSYGFVNTPTPTLLPTTVITGTPSVAPPTKAP